MSDFDPNATTVQRVHAAVKRRVVKDWRHRLADYSTIALTSLTALVGVWIAIPDDIKATFGPEVAKWFGRLLLALGAWGTVGKFIDQTGKGEE